MKINFKFLSIFIIFLLLVANIYLFTNSLFLSDNTSKIEKDMSKLVIENSELEKKLYSLTSLQNLTKISAFLGFTDKSEPIYLDNFKFASTK